MNRPKNPNGTAERNGLARHQKPVTMKSTKNLKGQFRLTKRPETEKQHDRVVNEDEQLKVVNQREDNAQSRKATFRKRRKRAGGSKENERLEAADDNNEVNPRSPKVN